MVKRIMKTYEEYALDYELSKTLDTRKTSKTAVSRAFKDKYNKIYLDYLLMLDVVDDTSNENSTDVIVAITRGNFEKDAEKFYNSFTKSKKIEFLTPYKISDLEKFDLFKVKGYNIGFAIKPDGDIILVHNNEKVKGIGDLLLKKAIENGGTSLDHFDGFLTGFYSRFGFIEDKTKREGWNDDLASIYWKYEKVNIFDPNFSVYANEINDNNVYLYRNEIKRYSEGKPDVIFRNII